MANEAGRRRAILVEGAMDEELVFCCCPNGHIWLQRSDKAPDPEGLAVFVFLQLIEHCPECGQRYRELWLS